MSASGTYALQLRQLMPSGKLWDWDVDSRGAQAIEGLAIELERIDDRCEDMLLEALPASADELLDDYAEILGVEATNEAVGAALASRVRQDEAFYQALGAAAGYTSGLVFSVPYLPYTCQSDCDWFCYTWQNRSVIHVEAVVPSEGDDEALQAALEASKQLHWVWDWGTL